MATNSVLNISTRFRLTLFFMLAKAFSFLRSLYTGVCACQFSCKLKRPYLQERSAVCGACVFGFVLVCSPASCTAPRGRQRSPFRGACVCMKVRAYQFSCKSHKSVLAKMFCGACVLSFAFVFLQVTRVHAGRSAQHSALRVFWGEACPNVGMRSNRAAIPATTTTCTGITLKMFSKFQLELQSNRNCIRTFVRR